jgi:hypothetical protein
MKLNLISILPDVVPLGGIAMQHHEKLGPTKLKMLSRQMPCDGTTNLKFITVQHGMSKGVEDGRRPTLK